MDIRHIVKENCKKVGNWTMSWAWVYLNSAHIISKFIQVRTGTEIPSGRKPYIKQSWLPSKLQALAVIIPFAISSCEETFPS